MRQLDDDAVMDHRGHPGFPQDLAFGEVLYQHPLAGSEDLAGWRLEGQAAVTFPQGRMRIESVIPVERGQKANYVLWCPVDFPDHAVYAFDFYPVHEPGLAMFWFSARGRQGDDLFNPRLTPRTGEYEQYHHGEMNAYHASYFRRGSPGAFQLCNLRKSHGFHLVAQGADPIPSFIYRPPYHIQVVQRGGQVQFSIDELVIWTFFNDGLTHGPLLNGGKLGFRQMAPLVAEYANLTVREVKHVS